MIVILYTSTKLNIMWYIHTESGEILFKMRIVRLRIEATHVPIYLEEIDHVSCTFQTSLAFVL